MYVIALDWSGDAHLARSHMWLAEAAEPGRLLRLEAGRDRTALTSHLIGLSRDLVIGLDFSLSFPSWFLRRLGLSSAPNLWSYVAEHGERWLVECEPPFWGRHRRTRPPLERPSLRRTEQAIPRTQGIAPKSIFQLAGAGSVGTGSLRGMLLLERMHRAGARIWPFVEGVSPVVVEIYPRLLTGPVHKSRADARAALLRDRYPLLQPEHARQATMSEDAFDAAVSALVMVEYVADLAALPVENDADLRLEGRIWHPGWRSDRP